MQNWGFPLINILYRQRFLVVLVSGLFFVEAAFACSCRYRSVQERFDDADFVFSAMVIAAELLIDPDSESWSSMDKIKITLEPRKEYKQDSSQLKFLYTNAGGASCGISVTIGKVYTFLVDESGFVGLCGGTIKNTESEEFYDFLLERGLLNNQ